MRRREVLGMLGGSAASWPFGAPAQQSPMPVIGFLSGNPRKGSEANLLAFLHGLGEGGFVVGQNVQVEYRWADGNYDRLPALVADLLNFRVSAIATTGGTASALAAKQATTTIPVIFLVSIDPVQLGLVSSDSRPGGNVTGINFLLSELTKKRSELINEVVPSATSIGLLVNPSYPDAKLQVPDAQAAAHLIGKELVVLGASTDDEIERAFGSMGRKGLKALVLGNDPFFNSRAEKIGDLAAGFAIPMISALRQVTAAGGLMSYGTSIADAYRQLGIYTSRVLKGDKPADLPVEQTVKVELVVNLKVAKALAIDVPMSLLMRIDEVIE